MELVAGRDAGGTDCPAVPFPSTKRCVLRTEIREALEAAHEREVVHPDMEPANSWSPPDGQVKVLDFGLAKALDADATEPDLAIARRSRRRSMTRRRHRARHGCVHVARAGEAASRSIGAPTSGHSAACSTRC